jgi:hypothetical protein
LTFPPDGLLVRFAPILSAPLMKRSAGAVRTTHPAGPKADLISGAVVVAAMVIETPAGDYDNDYDNEKP